MAIVDSKKPVRDVLTLFNPKSGVAFSPSDIFGALGNNWDMADGINLYYQESKSPEDGIAKAKRAIEKGVDTIIIVGGDGMVNTIGSQLIGTDVKLAVLPAGSGNGFARHFDIPPRPEKAAPMLLKGRTMGVDVGFVNDRPFFVTASLAWDADLVTGFQKFPVRGIAPYVFAAVYHYFTYEPQVFDLVIDGKEVQIHRPLVLTVANLTQFGGGAKIAPQAQHDDGELTLVAVPHMEPVILVSKLRRLFDGSIQQIPELETYSFKELIVRREREDPIQVDGELMEAKKDLVIRVEPKALKVIVPRKADLKVES